MATLPEVVNSIGTSLKKLWQSHDARAAEFDRRLKALESRQRPVGPAEAARVPVHEFPAPDPLMDTSESDAEFEDIQEGG